MSLAVSLPLSAGDDLCFHCALPIVAGADFHARIGGAWRAMCCPGCKAVAETIADRGLESYYSLRSAFPGTPVAPDEEIAAEASGLAMYDDPLVQLQFVREVAPLADQGEPSVVLREAELLIEGMRCPACAWLVEQTLAGMPGVRSASVIITLQRARVRW